jgi:hypothetical protein
VSSLFQDELESQAKLARNSHVMDYGESKSSMQVVRTTGRTNRWIPAFVANNSQLRCVILHATIGYVFRGGKVPATVQTDLQHLKELADRRQALVQGFVNADELSYWNRLAQTVNATERAGGYMALLAGVTYRAWRLRWHDREIADSLGLKPKAVAGIRERVVRYAKFLGYETNPPKRIKPDARAELAIYFWQQGRSLSQIAKSLPATRQFVRDVLGKAGLYKAYSHGEFCPKCSTPYTIRRACRKQQRICVTCLRKSNCEAMRKWRQQAFLKTVAWG